MAIQITKEQKGGVLHVKLLGAIDENTSFEQSIGGVPPSEIRLNCKEVSRINSTGVKMWIRYFLAAKQKGTLILFEECSPAIVEQFNLISNFACGGKIDSVVAPYCCESCKAEIRGTVQSAEMEKISRDPPPVPCPKCGKNAVFDDVPEEYFAFLARSAR